MLQEQQLHSGIVEHSIIKRFSRDMCSKPKSQFFAFGHLIYLLLKVQYQTQFVEIPKFKRHPHSVKAFSYQENILKNTSFKTNLLINQNPIKLKKNVYTKYENARPIFFILQVVGLSFVHIIDIEALYLFK